jgi:hypothetical protein
VAGIKRKINVHYFYRRYFHPTYILTYLPSLKKLSYLVVDWIIRPDMRIHHFIDVFGGNEEP